MNVKPRQRTLVVRSLALVLVSLFLTGVAQEAGAQPALSPEAALRRAEALHRSGKLLEAEPLYRQAVEASDEAIRARGHERLLTLYATLGRVDRAVQVGLRYQDFLKRSKGTIAEERPRRLRDLQIQLGECYLALGHYGTAETTLERALVEVRGAPLSPAGRLTILTNLARSAEKRGDQERAGRYWRQVEERARDQLARPGPALSPTERIQCAWQLADGYRFRKQPGPAIEVLGALLPLHEKLDDRKGKRDTLRRLAGHHAARAEHARAEKYLRLALDLHDRMGGDDRVLQADLESELASVVAAQGRPAEAERWVGQAARDYRAVLASKDAGGEGPRPDISKIITAFWSLQRLYQNTSQYRQALQLAEVQAEQWAGGVLAAPRLKSEEGVLRVVLGSFAEARPRLREAVAELERQETVNLIDLPRALNNLAIVEQATGAPDRAETLARRCLKLYREQKLPDDLVVVEAHNLLGTCAAVQGRYAQAIERFREGVTLCKKLGQSARPAHSNLLLNVALLHRSQGDTDEAARALAEALAVYRTFAEPDALGFAAFAAAQASLDTARGKIAEAHQHTARILALCKKYEIETGPLLVAAHHCEGLYRLQKREFALAERAWRQVLTLQEKEKAALLLPRTLNYLALTQELRGQGSEAETLYRRALKLQQESTRAFPVTHFITLWRLARLAERANRGTEARRLLDQAIGIVETARVQTYGESRERAAFFAQFEPGFEQLVERCLGDGDVEAAFVAATRSRSRTLLDQLQLAGVDPRTTLQGTKGQELRRREKELHDRISGLRARAQLIPVEAIEEKETKELLASLEKAQRDYAVVWREIVNANPVLRSLSAENLARELSAEKRERLLGPVTRPGGGLLLVYYIGQQRSHLLLLGGRGVRPEAFPLVVPAELANRLALPRPPGIQAALGGRGLLLDRRTTQPDPPPPPPKTATGPMVPLNQYLARALVDHYCLQIANANFRPTRGFRLESRDPARPVSTQSLELLGNIFLPPAVLRRIRAHRPECLVVVPDGALHKLPLEALLLEAGSKPRYALDELPPIVCAPSAAVLALLADRPRPARGPVSLLTVSNPAYPHGKRGRPADAPAAPQVLGLRGQLPLLPFTAEESRRIRKGFDPVRVTALEGTAATEHAVVAAMPGKRVVHLAAHGFADEQLGNLFGALALTPPPPGKEAGEDGFLSLHEIYSLPLKDCELVVLSACVTNVGPQRPLEAGVTLASGFLSAGARRVLASHWSVDDASTAALMASFFDRAMPRSGEALSYAKALQEARRKIRDTPRWSSPFYWAPFVLVGSAD